MQTSTAYPSAKPAIGCELVSFPEGLATYSYDDYGRRTALTRGNGTVTTTSYDGVSRMTGFTHDLSGSVQDLGVTGFTYNPANQILSYSRSNDSYAWKGHYNVNRSYTTNGLNQLTSAGATALSYDARGNLSASGASAYTYTSENRLATGPGGAALAYDSVGRLSQVYTPALSTNFDYAGTTLIGERDQISYGLLRRYVHGPGDDTPIVWYEGSGTTDKRYLMNDERGSITSVTNASGAVLGINSYDEYGIPKSTNIGRFGYTGQTWLPEIGMNYYKARMYSPSLGRFMQTDPIGYGDGVNWYAYVGSDPVNGTDPSGLWKTHCVGVGDELSCTRVAEPGDYDNLIGSVGNFGLTNIDFDFNDIVDEIVVVAQVICRVTFGGGRGTMQLGAAGTGQFGPVAGTGGGGIAIDRYGNIALYGYLGGGGGTGAYVGGGQSVQVSNADGVENLSGLFGNTSGSGGALAGASVDTFYGPSDGGPVSGGGATWGEAVVQASLLA